MKTKESEYLKEPTTGVTYSDFRVEEAFTLEDLAEDKKLTAVERHALLRILSMWRNLD